MFEPTREEARRFFCESWRKFRAGETLTPMEQRVTEIVASHPEYHGFVEQADRHLDRDFGPEGGELNPFLHLSLHLAVAEQIAIDQPKGIRAQYERLLARGDAHAAQHVVLECLGETLWQAQRLRQPPDAMFYLDCLARRAQ